MKTVLFSFITRIRFTDQGLPTIIQEDVHDCIERFLNFSCAVLTSIDPTNRPFPLRSICFDH